MTTSAVVKFDGGSRPDNPGPSAIGYIVETTDSTEEGNQARGELERRQVSGGEFNECVGAEFRIGTI